MQYLNNIDNIWSFDISQRFVCLLRNNKIIVDEKIYDFPESTAFYQIENKIYSALDFYLNKNNELIIPNHKKGLFFGGNSFEGIELFTSQTGMTYLFEENESTPIVKINREETPGTLVVWNTMYYVIRYKAELHIHSIDSGIKKHLISLSDYVGDCPVILENKIIVRANIIYTYLHSKSWSNFGFQILDMENGERIFYSTSFGPNFYLHQEKFYSIGRNKQIIQIMNPNTFEIEKVDLSNELGEFVFETQCTPFFYKNELYVALVKNGEDIYSYWAIIDLDTYRVKYLTEMLMDFNKKPTKNNKTFVSMIKANDKLVGIRVPGNILHIYEKETTPS